MDQGFDLYIERCMFLMARCLKKKCNLNVSKNWYNILDIYIIHYGEGCGDIDITLLL